MRRRVFVGLLMGIILSFGTFIEQAYGQDAGKIVFTTQNIAAGQNISATMLEERQFPPDKIPPDSVRSVSEAAGKVAKNPIGKGQILSKTDIK